METPKKIDVKKFEDKIKTMDNRKLVIRAARIYRKYRNNYFYKEISEPYWDMYWMAQEEIIKRIENGDN